jgi:hypothetical protein
MPTMTWTSFHRRGEVLRTVVDEVDARRDGMVPMDLPGVAETFRDELDLIAALSLRWHARLSGNVERALMGEPLDPGPPVALAWHQTCAELPGIRLLLDRCTDHPADAAMGAALAHAREKEWAGLAIAAGLASDGGAAAAAAGRRLVEDPARRGPDTPSQSQAARREPAATVDEPPTPSLVDRIRAVLAA